tara:strand:+ start:822 stop:1016 length:195 start_codon:yes stop_codon:yes gene_type:complete
MEHGIGDKIVNSENLKMGDVVDINLQEGKLKIQYADGLTEWVSSSTATNLLIDEQDYNSQFIQD